MKQDNLLFLIYLIIDFRDYIQSTDIISFIDQLTGELKLSKNLIYDDCG